MPAYSRFRLPPPEQWPLAVQLLILPHSRRAGITVGVLSTVALLATAYFDIVTGNDVDFSMLYGLIILVAFVFFRMHGLWWLAGVGIAYHVNQIINLHLYKRLFFLNDVLALTGYGIIGVSAVWLVDSLKEIERSEEVLRRDLQLARAVQGQMLSPPIRLPWVVVEGRLRPTGEIGGDFFVIEHVNEETVMFALGDVEGKGVAAALTMSHVVGIVSEVMKQGVSLPRLLLEVNRRMFGSDFGMVTVFAGAVTSREDGSVSLEYVKAGHENGVLLRGNGTHQDLEAVGLPIGVLWDTEFEERTVVLEPGDQLFCYTDGLSEARDPAREMFGRTRLRDRAAALASEAPPGEIGFWLDRLLDEVTSHLGDGAQDDDMALLGLAALPHL